jgi:2-aminoadipate transaminase
VSTIQFQQVVVAEGVIDLGVGQPNNAILPVDYVRRAAELQFSDSPEFLQYGAEWGDGYHRLALGEFLSDSYGVPVDPEQLFSTNGNSQALEMLCTVLTKPGACQNPTGVTMSAERRRELVTAAAAEDVLIVADEVYHLLRFAPGPMPPAMSAYVDDGPVLSIGTFSKILAPGMRLGWIHGSIATLTALADSGLILSGGGLNPVTSALATAMLRTGWQQEYLEWLRATFARRSAWLRHCVNTCRPGSSTTFPRAATSSGCACPRMSMARRCAPSANNTASTSATVLSSRRRADWATTSA